jgi:hypothetical protein
MQRPFVVDLEGGAAKLGRITLVCRSLGRRGLLAVATSCALAAGLASAAQAAVPAVDLDRLGQGELAYASAGQGGDRVRERRRDGWDADLADAGRRLGRIDQVHLDRRDRPHAHQRVTIEVLGHDLTAVTQDDFAPGRPR